MPTLVLVLVLGSTVLHAAWNLLVKAAGSRRHLFLHALLVIAVPGVAVALVAELGDTPILPTVWPLLIGASVCQAVYFLGLTAGYRSGEFTLVYPLARAIPVLLVGVFDVLRGRVPGLLGLAGLVAVFVGCVVVAIPARQEDRSWAVAPIVWALVAALGTVGYSIFDALAAEAIARQLGHGVRFAFRYGLWELTLTTVLYTPMLLALNRIGALSRTAAAQHASPSRGAMWRGGGAANTVLIAVLIYATYSIVLWAYQLSWQTSFVVALRQFSIVIGVVIGGAILREAAGRARVVGAVVIVAGVAALALPA